MDDSLPNVRHLAAFVATVEQGSVTRAAEKVHLTQPALTQAIARLESALDCQLFEREPSGMRPTPPALLLAARAQSAMARIGSSRVTTTQITAFLAVARAQSYVAAAERTGLSAASLHRAVGDLSIALGERLVERRGRHLALTRKGEARARALGLALADLRSGFAEVATWQGKASERIVIGAMPLSRARWLPAAIQVFSAAHPGVSIAVIEGSHGELSGPLRDGEIDFLLGALRDDDASDDLTQVAVFEDHPHIILRRGHPLDRHQPSIDDLVLYPWVMPSPETPLRRYWEQMIVAAGGTPPPVAIECGSVLTIRELLLNSDMLTLLSPDQVRVEIDARLLNSRAPPAPVARTIGITTRRDWRPTVSQREILDILHDSGRHFS